MNVGILGAARIAPLSIIDPARRIGGIDVRAVAARDSIRARVFADQHGITEVEESYDTLIARRDLDLVYIALPNTDHARWSIASLEQGHAVLCEKPAALTAAEAQAMAAAAAQSGRPLFEAFHYYHHRLMQWLVKTVATGRIGRLGKLEGWFVADLPSTDLVRWDAALGGGALYDLGCYPLHALRRIAGCEPQVVSATAVDRHGVDAELHAMLDFGDGVRGEVRCSLIAPQRTAGLRIEGEHGHIDVTNFVAPQLPHRVEIEVKGECETLHFDGPGTFDAQLAHIKAVMTNDAPYALSAEDMIDNAVAIEAMLSTARAAA